MIRSERVSQIALIMREVKDEISNYEEGLDREEFDLLIDEKIKKVSNDLQINETTCTDKITRQIGIEKKKFKDELWDFFIDKVPAHKTSLGERILSNISYKDNEKSVIDMLDSIKNH